VPRGMNQCPSCHRPKSVRRERCTACQPRQRERGCRGCGAGTGGRNQLCASCSDPEPRYQPWLDSKNIPKGNAHLYQIWHREEWSPWDRRQRNNTSPRVIVD
jgi:hypothetical protein